MYSNHPPHLTSSWGSAFVPFCAYKTDLNISENPLTLPGITFPLCSSFLPTILEGQLCYNLELKRKSGQGKINQLMLVLDYNEDRSLQASSKAVKDKVEGKLSSKSVMNFDTSRGSLQGVSAKVQINTLSPYIHFGGGTFKMAVVKKMTASADFLGMPHTERKCDIELYEGCRTRKLFEECKCVPIEVPGFKVRKFLSFVVLMNLQDLENCTPRGRDCIEAKSTGKFNCSTTCGGVYADLEWEEKQIGDLVQDGRRIGSGKELDREKFKEMMLEYKKFKKGKVKHFRFNTTGTVFGISKMFDIKCFLKSFVIRGRGTLVNASVGGDLL